MTQRSQRARPPSFFGLRAGPPAVIGALLGLPAQALAASGAWPAVPIVAWTMAGVAAGAGLTLAWRRTAGRGRAVPAHDQALPDGARVDAENRTPDANAEAAERLRVLDFQFASLPLAIIEWRADRRVRRWSPQAVRLFGWTADQMVGRTLRESGFLLSEEVEGHERLMAELIAGQIDEATSLRQVRHRDGHLLWCRWYTRVLRAPDGHIEYFFTAGLDITESRTALAVLDDRERQLRAIFDRAPVGIGRVDVRGRWLDVNARLCEITGYSRAELLTLDEPALTDPEDLEADRAGRLPVLRGERAGCSIEKRYRRRDGSTVWVRVNLGRIDPAEDRGLQLIAVVEDIGARKQLEREAAARQRRLDIFEENTPIAFIEWTADFRVRRWSRRAEAVFGWREAEVLGRTPLEWHFVDDDGQSPIGALTGPMQAGETSVTQVLAQTRHADGRRIWGRWHTSALSAPDGRVAAYLSLVDDVTEEQFALSALRDSQARFRALFQQAGIGIAMIDADSRWLMVNEQFYRIVGYSGPALLERTYDDIIDPEDRVREADLRRQLLACAIDDYSIEKRYLRADGSRVWVALSVRRLELDDGLPARLTLVVQDISARRESEARLAQLHEQLERKVADRTAMLQDAARRWAERSVEIGCLADMMGLLAAAVDPREVQTIVVRHLPRLFSHVGGEFWLRGEGEDDRQQRIADWNLADPGPSTLAVEDCWALRRGQMVFVDDPHDPLRCPHCPGGEARAQAYCCAPISVLGETVGLIHLRWSERSDSLDQPPDRSLLTTAAEQIGLAIGNLRLRDRLRESALRDPLTGLHNRRHFQDLAERRVAALRRHGAGQAFSLLMLDLDHFKQINDDYGHDAGDEVLRRLGELLRRTLRAEEAAFRLGGEEFVVLIDDPQEPAMAAVAERIRLAVAQLEVTWNGQPLRPLTVSIGAGHIASADDDLQALMARTDQALYRAKRSGRDRVCFALPPATPGSVTRRAFDSKSDQS